MAEEIYMTKQDYASDKPGVVKESVNSLKLNGKESDWYASKDSLDEVLKTANNAQASATLAQTTANEKISKSAIVQSTGVSETLIMSQKGITDALGTKADIADLDNICNDYGAMFYNVPAITIPSGTEPVELYLPEFKGNNEIYSLNGDKFTIKKSGLYLFNFLRASVILIIP